MGVELIGGVSYFMLHLPVLASEHLEQQTWTFNLGTFQMQIL